LYILGDNKVALYMLGDNKVVLYILGDNKVGLYILGDNTVVLYIYGITKHFFLTNMLLYNFYCNFFFTLAALHQYLSLLFK